MNFYEQEIAKYNRRIKRIEENPDPRYLRSNKLLYEIMRDVMMDELRAWQEGKPFIYLEDGTSAYVIRSFGVPIHHAMTTPYADRSVASAAKYLDVARSAGIPEWICDRVAVGVGLAITGDIPPPKLILRCSLRCGAADAGVQFLQAYFDCPTYMVDVHYDRSYEGITHITRQQEEIIDLIESIIPEAKFNIDKLIEQHEYAMKMEARLLRINKLRAVEPCPLSGKDVLRMPRITWGDPEKQLQYLSLYEEEMEEKIAKGRAGFEEKLRVAWLVSAPFYYDVWSFMETKGVVVPYYEFGRAAANFSGKWGAMGDDEEYGRKLTPLEEFPRQLLANTWIGPVEWRAEALFYMCKLLKIDVLIHYLLSGCPVNNGCSQLIAEKAKEELGIPSIFIEGTILDSSNFDQQHFESTLGEFLDIAISAKQSR